MEKLGATLIVPANYTISHATVKKPYTMSNSRFAQAIEQEILFDSLPQRFEFQIPIMSKDLVFYRQPPLTEEAKKEECKIWTTTHILTKEGHEWTRPIDAVDSLAVYHSYKRGNEAKTGKILSILPPKCIDDNGEVGWGKTDYQNGKLVFTLPEDFMKEAKYPVLVDPTFGYEVRGLSSWWINLADSICGYKFNLPVAGSVYNISFNAQIGVQAAHNCKCAIYESDVANAYEGESDEENVTFMVADTWYDLDCSAPIALTAGNYWLTVFLPVVANTIKLSYDGGVGGMGGCDQDPYNGFPNPYVPAGWPTDRLISIHADYNTTGRPLVTHVKYH